MDELIQQFQKARETLLETIEEFPEEKQEEILFDEWTLQEVIIHIQAWDKLTLDTLIALSENREAPRVRNVDVFNGGAIALYREHSWDSILELFTQTSIELENTYTNFPQELWEKQISESSDLTPKVLLQNKIDHYLKEHLPQIKSKMN